MICKTEYHLRPEAYPLNWHAEGLAAATKFKMIYLLFVVDKAKRHIITLLSATETHADNQ